MQTVFADGAARRGPLPPYRNRNCAWKARRSAISGAGSENRLCRQAIHGVSRMGGTDRRPTARRPATLVDGQLRHLESVVEYVTRGDASGGLHSLDHGYWEKRIRALEETYELIAAQRQRVTKLLERTRE